MGITAGADLMGLHSAFFIGVIAGVIVYFSVVFFDRVRVDDPVGAVSVHLVCGIWGTLAVGIFGAKAGADNWSRRSSAWSPMASSAWSPPWYSSASSSP